jgi:hypothetical protein
MPNADFGEELIESIICGNLGRIGGRAAYTGVYTGTEPEPASYTSQKGKHTKVWFRSICFWSNICELARPNPFGAPSTASSPQ